MSELAEFNDTEITEFILIGYSGRPKGRMGILAFMLIVFCISMVGNGLIIIAFISEPRLQNPMYFFLCNLSILDMCITVTSVPQGIANCLVDRPVMSYKMCVFQIDAGLYIGSTECFLLAVMAYDRFVAISNPLRYMLVMNWKACISLALFSWVAAFFLVLVPCLVIPSRFCGHNEVDQLTCELPAVQKLICSDQSLSQMLAYFTSTLTLLFPFSFILFSYLRIIIAVLRMHSSGGRWKAFSTCGSHLTVVCIYYGTSIFTYLKPQTKSMKEGEKILSSVYVIIPMLNPLIYTLRNQDVKGALKKLSGKNIHRQN